MPMWCVSVWSTAQILSGRQWVYQTNYILGPKAIEDVLKKTYLGIPKTSPGIIKEFGVVGELACDHKISQDHMA